MNTFLFINTKCGDFRTNLAGLPDTTLIFAGFGGSQSERGVILLDFQKEAFSLAEGTFKSRSGVTEL